MPVLLSLTLAELRILLVMLALCAPFVLLVVILAKIRHQQRRRAAREAEEQQRRAQLQQIISKEMPYFKIVVSGYAADDMDTSAED